MIAERIASVLVVEDERIVAKDIQQTLADLGYDAFAIASSAEEAIAHVEKKRPDIVLMDIRIKGDRDGIQTAEILKRRFDVPVIYLTAHADDATIERAKHTEPHGYLLKPVKSGELRSAIEVSLFKYQMDSRLRERERWFSTTLRSIVDAVITVDTDERITFMNPRAETLIEVSLADATGKRIHEVLRLNDPEHRTPIDVPLRLVLEQGQTMEIPESRLPSSTGEKVIQGTASPVAEAGKALGVVLVLRDVTEQRVLQKRLELTDRLASLGTMAAGVAHEVNNPLAVVITNASFVQREIDRVQQELGKHGDGQNGGATEGLVKRLNEAMQAQTDIQLAANQIAKIVSDLKTFARPLPRAAGNANVRRAIEWAIRSTGHELQHRARVTTDLRQTPHARIDETRLGQIVVNLLMNAAHAISPGNTRGNEVAVRSDTDAEGRIVVQVTDSGCGMTEDVLKRIFEPFFTTKPVGVGTGLGLSICHGIVQAAGGEIQVKSEVGKGTTFTIVLPAAQGLAPSIPPQETKKERFLCGRILVVDDEVPVLRAVRRILENHEVVCLEQGRDAMEMIQRGERFDVIISDLMMPGMNGFEFYEAVLRFDPSLARRIVFVSGAAATIELEDFMRSIPNIRLEKPFAATHLIETVQRLLAGQAAGPSRAKTT